jgi:hypothetical protein
METGSEVADYYLKRIGKLYEGHPLVLQVIAGDILNKPFSGNVRLYWQQYQREFAEIEKDRTQQYSGFPHQLLQLRVRNGSRSLYNSCHRMPILCSAAAQFIVVQYQKYCG